METTTQTIPTTFGTNPDPFRPNDLIPPAGVQAQPPNCPVCEVLLYPVMVNEKGDYLFECLNGEGHYEAVFRVATNRWEPRPGVVRPNWRAPGTKSKNPEVLAVQKTARQVMRRQAVQKPEPVKRPKRGARRPRSRKRDDV